MTDRSGRTRSVVGGLVLAVVLLVGGPFVYFQVIQRDAPAPLALSTPSVSLPAASASSGTTTTGSNGTWDVAPVATTQDNGILEFSLNLSHA